MSRPVRRSFRPSFDAVASKAPSGLNGMRGVLRWRIDHDPKPVGVLTFGMSGPDWNYDPGRQPYRDDKRDHAEKHCAKDYCPKVSASGFSVSPVAWAFIPVPNGAPPGSVCGQYVCRSGTSFRGTYANPNLVRRSGRTPLMIRWTVVAVIAPAFGSGTGL